MEIRVDLWLGRSRLRALKRTGVELSFKPSQEFQELIRTFCVCSENLIEGACR